jgi:NADPH:quinone reductase-like Zn-dependent oxidoreductase
LKKLGADHVINYKEDPNWGETAKKLTPGGEGATFVIEVGGPATMRQVSVLAGATGGEDG